MLAIERRNEILEKLQIDKRDKIKEFVNQQNNRIRKSVCFTKEIVKQALFWLSTGM